MNGDAVGSKNYSKMGQKAIVKRELVTTQLVPYQHKRVSLLVSLSYMIETSKIKSKAKISSNLCELGVEHIFE